MRCVHLVTDVHEILNPRHVAQVEALSRDTILYAIAVIGHISRYSNSKNRIELNLSNIVLDSYQLGNVFITSLVKLLW